MGEKKLQFYLPNSFSKNEADSLPNVYLRCVAVKFIYKEFVCIRFVYVNLKMKFIYEEINEFIYQD